MNIVVTGVGAVIGLGIVDTLRMCPEEVRVIGVDRNPKAFGQRRCDAFITKPTDEIGEDYLAFWQELIERNAVDLVIPGIEPDVFFFDANRAAFANSRARVVLNSAYLVGLGRDKWATFEALRDAGVPAIPSRIDGCWDDCIAELGPPPLLLKPRSGSGGRGIVMLDDEVDFDYWRNKSGSDFMVQRVVGSDDQEYTVAVFGLGNGKATTPAILRRTLGPVGATWWAETVSSCPPVETATAALNELLQPEGPTNYQFRLGNGTALLLEVNPRISASSSLRARLGVNEAWMCIEYYLHGRVPEPAALRAGQGWRFIADEVEVR